MKHFKSNSAIAGFTLIEVLVALAIVAVALAAGVQASNALVLHAGRQSDGLLAQLCAENELVKTRLSKQMPGLGDSDFSCEQAGRRLRGTLSVAATPNPNFLRVQAQVRDEAGQPLRLLATVVGRF